MAGLVGVAIVGVRCEGCAEGERVLLGREGERGGDGYAPGGARRGDGGGLARGAFPSVYDGTVDSEGGVYAGGGWKDALTRGASEPLGAPTSIAAWRSPA
jgi:hypothetical protein